MNTSSALTPIPAATPSSAALVYLVDDNPDLGDMLEVFLRGAGYETRIFQDPLQALASLEAEPRKPDLLITDFRMPGINGLELTRRSRAVHPDLRVIAASANVGETGASAGTVQPDRYLPKPYTTAQLLELARELLGR